MPRSLVFCARASLTSFVEEHPLFPGVGTDKDSAHHVTGCHSTRERRLQTRAVTRRAWSVSPYPEDTVATIAVRHGLGITEVKRANGLLSEHALALRARYLVPVPDRPRLVGRRIHVHVDGASKREVALVRPGRYCPPRRLAHYVTLVSRIKWNPRTRGAIPTRPIAYQRPPTHVFTLVA